MKIYANKRNLKKLEEYTGAEEMKHMALCYICKKPYEKHELKETIIVFVDPPEIVADVCDECIKTGEKTCFG